MPETSSSEEEEERVVEIKPVNPYIAHQVKVPGAHEEVVEIKPVNPYINKIKTQEPIGQEEVVEIKPPSPYVTQTKTTQPPSTSRAPTDGNHPTEEKKIVEYYIPIIQDIDDEKVVYAASKYNFIFFFFTNV